MTSPPKPVRIGVLAASKIATKALVEPAKSVDGVELVAVAARDLGRAQAAANEWGIPTAYGSYDELLTDDTIDAVYIATPASLHRPWTIAALEAGKHVLVEKPLAANAQDARLMQEASDAKPELVCMEAFHWRFHPFNQRWIEMIADGAVGEVRQVESRFNLPVTAIPEGNIRWDLSIGGGATMDLGCYSIQWARAVVDAAGLPEGASSVPEVVSALVVAPVPEVDGRLTATLRYGGDVPIGGNHPVHVMVESSMIESAAEGLIDLRVVGSDGELVVRNPLTPYTNGKITSTKTTGTQTTSTETTSTDTTSTGTASSGGASVGAVAEGGSTVGVVDVDDIPGGRESTYYYQLVAFRDAVRTGAPFPTTMASGVINMEIIDACYRAAGLSPRPSAPDA